MHSVNMRHGAVQLSMIWYCWYTVKEYKSDSLVILMIILVATCSKLYCFINVPCRRTAAVWRSLSCQTLTYPAVPDSHETKWHCVQGQMRSYERIWYDHSLLAIYKFHTCIFIAFWMHGKYAISVIHVGPKGWVAGLCGWMCAWNMTFYNFVYPWRDRLRLCDVG